MHENEKTGNHRSWNEYKGMSLGREPERANEDEAMASSASHACPSASPVLPSSSSPPRKKPESQNVVAKPSVRKPLIRAVTEQVNVRLPSPQQRGRSSSVSGTQTPEPEPKPASRAQRNLQSLQNQYHRVRKSNEKKPGRQSNPGRQSVSGRPSYPGRKSHTQAASPALARDRIPGSVRLLTQLRMLGVGSPPPTPATDEQEGGSGAGTPVARRARSKSNPDLAVNADFRRWMLDKHLNGRLATVDMLAKNQHPQHYRPRLNSEPPDEVFALGMRRSTSNHFRDELRLERGAAHESRRSTEYLARSHLLVSSGYDRVSPRLSYSTVRSPRLSYAEHMQSLDSPAPNSRRISHDRGHSPNPYAQMKIGRPHASTPHLRRNASSSSSRKPMSVGANGVNDRRARTMSNSSTLEAISRYNSPKQSLSAASSSRAMRAEVISTKGVLLMQDTPESSGSRVCTTGVGVGNHQHGQRPSLLRSEVLRKESNASDFSVAEESSARMGRPAQSYRSSNTMPAGTDFEDDIVDYDEAASKLSEFHLYYFDQTRHRTMWSVALFALLALYPLLAAVVQVRREEEEDGGADDAKGGYDSWNSAAGGHIMVSAYDELLFHLDKQHCAARARRVRDHLIAKESALLGALLLLFVILWKGPTRIALIFQLASAALLTWVALSGFHTLSSMQYHSMLQCMFTMAVLPLVLHMRSSTLKLTTAAVLLSTLVIYLVSEDVRLACESTFWTSWVILMAIGVLVISQAKGKEIRMSKYFIETSHQQQMFEEHTALLQTMLPPKVLPFILNSHSDSQSYGEEFESCTIMMLEVNMDEAARFLSPNKLVRGLNRIFTLFDVLIDESMASIYKVETVSSVYMVASGVPEYHPKHASLMIDLAIRLLDISSSLHWQVGHKTKIRIGIHTGSVFAGVPGKICPRYRFFGDTVNTAARVQSRSEWGRIWLSGSTVEALTRGDAPSPMRNWELYPLGEFWFKGKGHLAVWEVEVRARRRLSFQEIAELETNISVHMTEASAAARSQLRSLFMLVPDFQSRESQRAMLTSSTGLVTCLGDGVQSLRGFLDRALDAAAMCIPQLRKMYGGLEDPPDVGAVDPFKDAEIHPMWLTFRTPAVEQSFLLSDTCTFGRCIAALTGAGCMLVVLGTTLYSTIKREVQGKHHDEDDEGEHEIPFGFFAAFSVAVMVLTSLLVACIVHRPHWVVRWWHFMAFLMMLIFVTWDFTTHFGFLMHDPLSHYGVALVWILSIRCAFNLPFRFALPASVYVCTLAMLQDSHCHVALEDCPGDSAYTPRTWWMGMLVPALLVVYNTALNDVNTRVNHKLLLQCQLNRTKVHMMVEALLPEQVFSHLQHGSMLINHQLPSVCQLFTDIVGFTSQAARMKPAEVFDLIAGLFGQFDDLTTQYGVMKIETIGDAYWACTGAKSGVPSTPVNATQLVQFAFSIIDVAGRIYPLGKSEPALQMRIGLHAGPAIGGIVGATMPRYHLFGPHVTISNKMESWGSNFYLHATNSFTSLLLQDSERPSDIDVMYKDPSDSTMLPSERIKWERVQGRLNFLEEQLPRKLFRQLSPVSMITREKHARIKVEITPSEDDKVRVRLLITRAPGTSQTTYVSRTRRSKTKPLRSSILIPMVQSKPME